MLRAKVQGGNATWDVVQVESEELAAGCEEGLFVKIDWAKIGGKGNYIPQAVNDCGVGAILYDFVLGYDKAKIKNPPKSWADFFDTKKYPGKRALRAGPKTTLEIALMADGVAPKDVYKVLATPAGVDRAFKKLDTIKKDLIFWKAGAQPPQLLASGEVAMTSVYNGRIDAANRDDHRNFGISWNGALYTLDSWVILKGTPNLDSSYKLLDFMGKPAEPGQAARGDRLRRHRQGRERFDRQEAAGGVADRRRQLGACGADQCLILAGEHRSSDRALQQVGGDQVDA